MSETVKDIKYLQSRSCFTFLEKIQIFSLVTFIFSDGLNKQKAPKMSENTVFVRLRTF